tara:strand:- start:95 stop:316 length:222 start_codon:yes stop_codon:yes gene_type:complete
VNEVNPTIFLTISLEGCQKRERKIDREKKRERKSERGVKGVSKGCQRGFKGVSVCDSKGKAKTIRYTRRCVSE